MQKIVFICRGNMFRSQLAKAIYNNLGKEDSVAESYGTAVTQEKRDNKKLSSYPELKLELDFMKEKGIDMSDEYCKQITPAALDGVSTIILMSEEEYTPEWLKQYPYTYWKISNPTTLTSKIVQDTYDLLLKKIAEIHFN